MYAPTSCTIYTVYIYTVFFFQYIFRMFYFWLLWKQYESGMANSQNNHRRLCNYAIFKSRVVQTSTESFVLMSWTYLGGSGEEG